MSSSSFRLIERTGPNPGETFELTGETMMIGRDVTNDIVVADAEISRQHARINRTPGGYVLEDLGSTNGSFVNGERLVAPRVLNPGDLVGLGENATLTFQAVSAEAAATVMATPGQA
ncbi:MAG: FHA domain-containing protein, partial [Anaerolineales bacterium]